MPGLSASLPLRSTAARLKRIATGVCLVGTALISGVAAAETASIHLHDGTTVRGEVISLKGGNYQVQSGSLGTLNIAQDKIKLVEYGSKASAAVPEAPAAQSATAGAAASQLSAITSRLQSSPDLLNNVQSLTQDPDIMAVVQDREIQRLIAAGDYAALMQNAKMRRLMNNPKVRSLTNALK